MGSRPMGHGSQFESGEPLHVVADFVSFATAFFISPLAPALTICQCIPIISIELI